MVSSWNLSRRNGQYLGLPGGKNFSNNTERKKKSNRIVKSNFGSLKTNDQRAAEMAQCVKALAADSRYLGPIPWPT